MENYFNFFTEIEDRYQRRRGSLLLLSTLDWALIETWKDAGIPLAAVLRGIDATFDKWERRPSKSKKVNSLAYCAQEVLAAAEEMKEAAVGAQDENAAAKTSATLDPAAIAAYLEKNAATLRSIASPALAGLLDANIKTLRELAGQVRAAAEAFDAEDLERRLLVMEEKLYALLLAHTPDDDIVAVRSEADRAMAPYRSKMAGPQLEQLQKQFVQKRLLEKVGVPRLSLFYM